MLKNCFVQLQSFSFNRHLIALSTIADILKLCGKIKMLGACLSLCWNEQDKNRKRRRMREQLVRNFGTMFEETDRNTIFYKAARNSINNVPEALLLPLQFCINICRSCQTHISNICFIASRCLFGSAKKCRSLRAPFKASSRSCFNIFSFFSSSRSIYNEQREKV